MWHPKREVEKIKKREEVGHVTHEIPNRVLLD